MTCIGDCDVMSDLRNLVLTFAETEETTALVDWLHLDG